MADNHYTEGRRYSHIHKAWILESSWNDSEEIAALRAQLAERDARVKELEEQSALLQDGKPCVVLRFEEYKRWQEEVGRLREAALWSLASAETADGMQQYDQIVQWLRAPLKGEG